MAAITIQDETNRKNLSLLIMLRWLAVAGQVGAIAFVHVLLGIPLPLVEMGGVVLFLIGLNVVSLYRCRSRAPITDTELFLELLLDVAALTVQLYLSGGATNPFVSLFLLQVILGSALLREGAQWTLVGVTSGCFVFLTTSHRDLSLAHHAHGHDAFDLHIQGMFLCFLLAAILIVLFVGRINENLRQGDARLSELHRQSVEEEHIVRMGLLASGAAHELGTPLATLSVILNDWRRVPDLKKNETVQEEIDEMQMALDRCKGVVSQVLLAAGETRGEGAEPTTLAGFLDQLVREWCETRGPSQVEFSNRLTGDIAIVSDAVIKQTLFNVFDNALEASPGWIGIEVACDEDSLTISVRDRGPGFPADILSKFGKPYQTTKSRAGGGLGLFLVVNVMRKLGGHVRPFNPPEGGARVDLHMPLAVLLLGGPHAGR